MKINLGQHDPADKHTALDALLPSLKIKLLPRNGIRLPARAEAPFLADAVMTNIYAIFDPPKEMLVALIRDNVAYFLHSYLDQ